MAPAILARRGAVWDGRFRLPADGPAGATFGALGPDAAALRRSSPLPAAVLRTLPAVRTDENLFAVPHLRYVVGNGCSLPAVDHCTPAPVAGAPFMPCQEGGLLP
jgi:tRNA(Ile)-lysidine synthase